MDNSFDGLPWAYRPKKYDDWGCIKNADGDIVLNIRPPANADLDAHRAAKTDPCEAIGLRIVALANATPAPSGRDPATITDAEVDAAWRECSFPVYDDVKTTVRAAFAAGYRLSHFAGRDPATVKAAIGIAIQYDEPIAAKIVKRIRAIAAPVLTEERG